MGNRSKWRQKPPRNGFLKKVVRVSGYGLLVLGVITAVIVWVRG